MEWENAERVQKNDAGQYRAFIGGEWVPVERAQKNETGEIRVVRPSSDKAGIVQKTEPKSAFSPENLAANPLTRFAVSSAKPFIGGAQILENLARKIPGVSPAIDYVNSLAPGLRIDIGEMDRLVKEGNKGKGVSAKAVGTLADLAGYALSPVNLAMGQAVTVPATYAGKVATGAGLGAVAGGLVPTTGINPEQERAVNTGLGVVLGGLIPAVVPAVKSIAKGGYHALIEPFTKSGQEAIKGRAYLEAAGDKAPTLIRLLKENKAIIPGSPTTAGEVATPAGRAEFSALQRSAAGVAPSEYRAVADAQNAARIAQLRTVGQDEPALKMAEAARKAASDPLYKAAREGGEIAKAGGVMTQINQLLGKNPGNRELVTELNNIKKGLLDKEGKLRVNTEEVASVLDGLKAAMAKEDNKFIAGALNDLKTKLSKAIPGYEQAQKVFAGKSIPINQMKVGQYLEGKLVPALDEAAAQKASTFATAVRDATGTIKKSTGQPRFEKLSEVLTKEQMAAVNSVKDDLARASRFNLLAKEGSRAGPNAIDVATQSMEKAVGGKIPNPLNRHVMVFNQIMHRLEGKVNKKLAAEISAEMLNPPKVGESLKQAAQRESKNKFMAERVYKLSLAPQMGTIQAIEDNK